VKKIVRTARGAVVALALVLVVAAPAAAAQPLRTVIDGDPATRELPAGTFCDINVTTVRPRGFRLTVTDFSDGREALVASFVGRTYTNDETGATFAASTTALETDWFDAIPLVRGVATGQFIYQLVPGDVGPGGVVVDHLLELYIQGQATYVYDSNTGATLELTILGTATDICAAIS
jgi:hypothetical protein